MVKNTVGKGEIAHYSLVLQTRKNQGMFGKGLRTILRKSCVHSRYNTFVSNSCKMVRIFVIMKSEMSLKLGHGESKSISLVRIPEKFCMHSIINILCPFRRIGCKNDCLVTIFENGLQRGRE